jgi:dynein heavy chain 1
VSKHRHQLPYTPYETFDRLLSQTTNIFRTWDDLIKEFTDMAREVTRKQEMTRDWRK